METLEFILLVSAAVLLSSVINQVLPRISAPLIQIGLGLLITLFAWSPITLNLTPDYFLLLFIAPLLFYDSKRADRTALWKNRRSIVSLALALVVAIMLIVGFTLNWLVPSIPLAAALALGAALGPTDAVAVTSLKSEVKMTRRENALLGGEALINDASGVVAFQFAIAAAVTGSYTLLTAATDFVISFFGGLALGVLIAVLTHALQGKIRNMGLESQTFFVLLDILMPFFVYLIAEMVGVSGILAVVACGLLLGAYEDRRSGPSVSKLNIVSSSVWKVLTFLINGIVFVILGMQLPLAFTNTWANPYINNTVLIILIFALTLTLVLVRFAWILLMERIERDPHTRKRTKLNKQKLLSTLAMTLGGPKGAVTLSIVLSIPFTIANGTDFPERDLLIFLASGVILCTLLLANFLLPVVSPTPKKSAVVTEFEEKAPLRVEILRDVIRQLSAEQTAETAAATHAVIRMYNDRIQRIMRHTEQESGDHQALEIEIVCHQEEYISTLLEAKTIDPVVGYRLARRLEQRERILTHHHGFSWLLKSTLRHARLTFTSLRVAIRELLPGVDEPVQAAAMRELRILCEEDTIRYLDDLIAEEDSPYPPEMLGKQISRYSLSRDTLVRSRPSITAFTETTDRMDEVARDGYEREIHKIRELYDSGEISRGLAKMMRENVYLMQIDLENRLS